MRTQKNTGVNNSITDAVELEELAHEGATDTSVEAEVQTFSIPDDICTGCKYLVLSQNVVYWPQMCYRNAINVTNLQADGNKQPLRSVECMVGGWKDIEKQVKKW